MHLSNKYSPWGRGRKPWACWKITKRTHRHLVHQRHQGWLELARCPLYETNSPNMGAFPKNSGAWTSNCTMALVRAKKRHSNKHYRMLEKRELCRLCATGCPDDDFCGLRSSTGW